MRPSYESSIARPEDRLLRAAAGVPSTATVRESINRALSAKLDWTRVIELALAHRMTPALLAALEVADPSLVPTDLLAAVRHNCSHLRDQSRAQVKELLELLEALRRRSVIAVPFKGPVLGQVLFDDPCLRPSGDLDLLVRPEDVTGVCEVLEARGYVDGAMRPGASPLTPTQHGMYRRFQCEYRYVRASDGLVVEPHWAFSQHPLAVDVDYAGMLGRARPTRLGDHTTLTLAPEDLLLALCIHGLKHRWERLTWIRDVGALVACSPDLDFDALVARARTFGCARLLLVGLAVASMCTGVQLPVAVERLIETDRMTGVLANQVLARLFDAATQSPRNDRIERFRFQSRERWSDRIRYVARTLLSPGRDHIEIVALPEALRWAYFPLKWVHDFGLLPLWRIVKPRS